MSSQGCLNNIGFSSLPTPIYARDGILPTLEFTKPLNLTRVGYVLEERHRNTFTHTTRVQSFKHWSVSDVKRSALGKVCKHWIYSAFPWQWDNKNSIRKIWHNRCFLWYYISYLPAFTCLIVYNSDIISHYAIVEVKTIPLESEIIIDKLLRNSFI